MTCKSCTLDFFNLKMTFETLGVAFLATDANLFIKLYIEKIKTEQPLLIALKEA